MTLSLATVLADSALRRPDHPALVQGDRSLSYAELWCGARRYAAVLRARGIRPGDRVALLLPNTRHFPLAYFGALAAGAVVVPVHGLLRAEEIAYVLTDCGADLLVCSVPLLVEGAPAAQSAAVPVLTVPGGLSEERAAAPAGPAPVRLDELAERAEPLEREVSRDAEDLAVVLYTSGTTGHPKGVMLTHLNLVLNVTTTMLSPFDLDADDVLLGALPLFHTFGQICGMNACFRAGATLVLMERFDGAAALDLLVRQECTVFMGVPTMYHALLDAAARDPRRPARLNRVYSGGSALPVPVLNAVEALFGCPVYEGYGLTEASPVVAYNQKPWPRRAGTVGRPVWGVDVEIARPELEGRIELLPAGEVGEIVVRGHNVMAGYLGRPEATAEVLVDGWLRTGDLGRKDAGGYLAVVDRKKDMVLRGGYNVYPREVEETLLRHPAVAQVCVVGVPDAVHGEEVCAVVVTRPGFAPGEALAAEIRGWGRQRMAAYKYPRRVEFVDALPLGTSGKVLKRELTAYLAARHPA